MKTEFVYIAVRIMLAVFMLICGYQDLRQRSVEVRVFVIMAIITVVYLTILLASGEQIKRQMLGTVPGLLMFLLSKTIHLFGVGDCIYFSVVGAVLGIEPAAFILTATIFLCGIIGTTILLISISRGGSIRTAYGQKLPMLTAAAAAGLFCLIREGGMIL